MSQYTMELREIVANYPNNIFGNYPIFDENYRKHLEDRITEHFYFREIGEETVSRFIYKLQHKMKVIMPIYNKMYKAMNLEQRILDNYDVTETYERSTKGISTENSNGSSLNLASDTPQGRIDINSNDFVSNINKNSGTNESNSNSEGNEKWIRTMVGNIGVQTDADAVNKYIESLKNVDEMIFEELSVLFMGIY